MRPQPGETSKKEYKIQDYLGSTRIVLDSYGGIISQIDYKPFGEVSWQSGQEHRLSWIAKEKDKESSLSDFGVRKYEDGRFLSIDPDWELYRNVTPYNYCENNPLVQKDPSGYGPGDGPNKKMLPAGYDGGGGGASDIGKEGSEYKPSSPNQTKAGGESSAKPRTSTIQANKAQGKATETQVNAKIDATNPKANETQVTVKSTESGTKMRADNLVKTQSNQNVLNETKSTAKVINTPQEAMKLLSNNQRAVMTEAANGVQVQVRGENGKPTYTPNATISVDKVQITVSDPQGLKVFQVTPSTTK